MNMFDEARAMAGTIELCGITQKELGERMGVSQSYIANKMRLLSFSPGDEELILSLGLSERHARSILRLPERERTQTIKRVGEARLTVRECEAIVDSQVVASVPVYIEKAKGLERLDAFLDGLKKSVEILISGGLDIQERTSYSHGNMYVMLKVKM